MQSDMTIRPITDDDEDVVVQLFLEMLQELEPFGHDMLPVLDNAELFYRDVIAETIPDQTVLLAENDEGVQGALFWKVVNTGYATRWRSAVGYGTYVRPEYRRRGLASTLREAGLIRLRELAVERLYGTVLTANKVGMASSERFTPSPVAIVQEYLV